MPDKIPSDSFVPDPSQKITLRIPSVSPALTVIMLIVLLVVFLLRLPNPPDADPVLMALGVQGTALFTQTQLYRLLTALVLVEQSSWWLAWLHMLVSGYTLFIVGASSERLWGHLRFGLMFLLGGATGILASLLLVSVGIVPENLYLVAAPNAILSTLGGEIVYMYRHRRLYGLRGRQRRTFLTTMAVINLLLGAFAPRVDLFGMIGGLLGGAVLAWFIAPFHVLRPHPDDVSAILGEDANPLQSQIVPLALYVTALVGILALGVAIAR